MAKKILIAEDEFIEANDIQLILTRAGYTVCGIARSVDVALKLAEKEKPDFVLVDIFLKGKLTGIDLARQLNERNIPFIYISANSNEDILSAAKTMHPYGFIVKPFREKDLLVTLEIAQYRYEHSLESQYRKEKELLAQLEDADSGNKDIKGKLLQVAVALQQYIAFDLLTAGYDKHVAGNFHGSSFLRIGFSEYQALNTAELETVTRTHATQLQDIYSGNERFFQEALQMQSSLFYKLKFSNGDLFNLCFYTRNPAAFNNGEHERLQRLQHHITKSIERIVSPSVQLAPIAAMPSVVVAKRSSFDGVIGNGYTMMNIFDKITQVAPYDTSVLVLGESGTGKERIADYIHRHSARRDNVFVKINCAALPPTLIESELFGHEKGAFTGATEKRAGKFLQAHGGTIFLDEIGEMPSDMQVKLLRVLQEKEIEPVGGRSTIKVDVRIITATNRNLEKEVAEGRFRLDLYYRLNVFPIQLPSLRERKEDIHSLALHFISLYNKKAGKRIDGISDSVLVKLTSYNWPGNIRELENLVERSVLLAKGNTIEEIDMPLHVPGTFNQTSSESHIKTIDEMERDHILIVLAKTNGKIWGAGGAAELLNIPPTTLSSKMKKLGIKKGFGL